MLDELHVIPSKIAGLSVISSELANDSSPQAAQAIGDGLARDIARRVDQAYFGAMAAPAQSGLGALSGIQTYVAAGAFGSLDFAAQAISKVQTVFANDDTSHAPDVALQLATIKALTGGAQPVLGMDATSATSRTILGVPMTVSPYVAAGTLRALDSSRVFVVVRTDATVEVDSSPFFTTTASPCAPSCGSGSGSPSQTPSSRSPPRDRHREGEGPRRVGGLPRRHLLAASSFFARELDPRLPW